MTRLEVLGAPLESAEVYVFDYSKHPSKPPLDGTCNPDLRLRGHSSEGYGLSWSIFKDEHLLSGSDDAQICMWDIKGNSKNKTLDALQIFKEYTNQAMAMISYYSTATEPAQIQGITVYVQYSYR